MRRSSLAGAMVALALTALAPAAVASFPGRNGRLAYSSPSGVSSMRADGTHRRLLSGLAGATQPAWAPGGRRIAFAADHGAAREIYVMRADGRKLRRITTNSVADLSPSWSPGAGRLALVRGSGDLRIVRLDGTSDRLLVHGGVVEASWAPDGRLIAYSTGSSVYVVSPAGGAPLLIADLGGDQATDLEWQPPGPFEQGGIVAFTRYLGGPCDEGCTAGVWAVPGVETSYFFPHADVREPERLTPWRAGQARNAVWSPNQRRIVYCQPAAGFPITFDLHAMRWDGTKAHRVAHAPCPSDWQSLPEKGGAGAPS